MQSNLEQTSEEMNEMRDRIKQLESENDRLKTSVASSKSLERERLVEGLALSPAQAAVKEVTEGLSSLRNKYSRSQSAENKASVKGLIGKKYGNLDKMYCKKTIQTLLRAQQKPRRQVTPALLRPQPCHPSLRILNQHSPIHCPRVLQ